MISNIINTKFKTPILFLFLVLFLTGCSNHSMIVSNKQGKSASRNELIIATCNEGNLRSAVMQFNAEYEGKEITINEDGTFDVDGVHMDASYDPTPGITKEQITKFYKLIEQCRTAYDYDSDLNAIIRNTSERFFAGQITVEQAVEDVSVRANLYLEEQKRH